jgi:hypothetical protein
LNSDPNHTLESFVERFFACRGAVVEKRCSGLDLLVPGDLARRVGIPEYCHLAVEGESPDSYSVNYGSPLLEAIIQTAEEQIPLTIGRLAFHYLKSQGFDRLIQERFTFHGAIVRVDNTAEVLTEYLLLNCRFLAQSDEQKEGLIPLAFNMETGAPVGNLEEMLDATEKEFEPDGPCSPFEAEKSMPSFIGSTARRPTGWKRKSSPSATA